jgi:hypothetical protein
MERFKHYQVERAVYQKLANLWLFQTRTQPKGPNYRLFCHIVASSFTQFRRQFESGYGWLSIPSTFIQAKFRNANPESLTQWSLIEIDRHYIPGFRTRQYRLTPLVIDSYVRQSELHKQGQWVDLFTGKPWQDSWNTKADKEIKPTPLIQQAMASITTCYVNVPMIEHHLNKRRFEDIVQHSTRSAFRYLNDWCVYEAIRKQGLNQTNRLNVSRYTPRYQVQQSGRIGTPLQSASREMKAAAYTGIPNLHNYDLSSSQVRIIAQAMTSDGIECQWLDDYITNPGKRARLAEAVGISEDAWKECLCSLLMGAHLPTNTKHPSNQSSAIITTLRQASESPDNEHLNQMLTRLRQSLKGLTQPLKQWQTLLCQRVEADGHLTNATGLKRSWASFQSNRGAIVAHYLQGLEAFYIHTLTTLADEFGFQVIGNEHDGLITIGEIPIEAINKANQLTGINYLELREKPFCSKST